VILCSLNCLICGSHDGGYEEYSRLVHDSVEPVNSSSTFCGNISPPSSRSSSKFSKYPARRGQRAEQMLPQSSWLLDLFFESEDGGDMFLRNVAEILSDYTE
jgi:hypothetical protein